MGYCRNAMQVAHKIGTCACCSSAATVRAALHRDEAARAANLYALLTHAQHVHVQLVQRSSALLHATEQSWHLARPLPLFANLVERNLLTALMPLPL